MERKIGKKFKSKKEERIDFLQERIKLYKEEFSKTGNDIYLKLIDCDEEEIEELSSSDYQGD